MSKTPAMTPEELDALSAISASETVAAQAAWKKDTDPAGSELLDAKEDL